MTQETTAPDVNPKSRRRPAISVSFPRNSILPDSPGFILFNGRTIRSLFARCLLFRYEKRRLNVHGQKKNARDQNRERLRVNIKEEPEWPGQSAGSLLSRYNHKPGHAHHDSLPVSKPLRTAGVSRNLVQRQKSPSSG